MAGEGVAWWRENRPARLTNDVSTCDASLARNGHGSARRHRPPSTAASRAPKVATSGTSGRRPKLTFELLWQQRRPP
ncbi:hypothetical protein IG631_09509 [Alternaria alternata]|nr:hypothetical protein IG631_09509 [Alternaria alternata]